MIVSKTYASVLEAANAAEERGGVTRGSNAWAGGSFSQALHWLREGDESYVPLSETLLSRFEEKTFLTLRREWEASQAGFIPDVPAFLAGHPASMRTRRKRESERGAVTIFIDCFASAAFSGEDITKRGVAVLALVRVLSQIRPIELYYGYASTAHSGNTIAIAVKIDTTPLDLAHASYALCAPSMIRQIACSLLEKNLPGSYPFPKLASSVTLAQIATSLGLGERGEQLLLIPGIVLGRVAGDPEGWIMEKLREVSPEEEFAV